MGWTIFSASSFLFLLQYFIFYIQSILSSDLAINLELSDLSEKLIFSDITDDRE